MLLLRNVECGFYCAVSAGLRLRLSLGGNNIASHVRTGSRNCLSGLFCLSSSIPTPPPPSRFFYFFVQIERQSRALDKKAARMQAEHREEAKEGLGRDVLESREALGLAPAGEDGEEEGEGQEEEEAVPPQVLKERIESVIEVLSAFQVRSVRVLPRACHQSNVADAENCLVLAGCAVSGWAVCGVSPRAVECSSRFRWRSHIRKAERNMPCCC